MSSESPSFRINLEGRHPASVSQTQRDAIAETMTEFFGIPDEPRLPEGTGLGMGLIEMAAGPVAGDSEGKQQGL
ncbi:MAG: hypothetical protein ACYC6Y_19350, partial [Thermoguttaceae bacterium]